MTIDDCDCCRFWLFAIAKTYDWHLNCLSMPLLLLAIVIVTNDFECNSYLCLQLLVTVTANAWNSYWGRLWLQLHVTSTTTNWTCNYDYKQLWLLMGANCLRLWQTVTATTDVTVTTTTATIELNQKNVSASSFSKWHKCNISGTE